MKKVDWFWFKRRPVLSRMATVGILWGGLYIVLGLWPWIAKECYLFAFLVAFALFVGGYLFCKALALSVSKE